MKLSKYRTYPKNFPNKIKPQHYELQLIYNDEKETKNGLNKNT
ncbi:hypothetical protein [Dipodfec virus UA23Rod_1071]|uniref:Uncharacterized protein n=1 Tax=Dipodfec virus UA23Rod_1071 TaxID=2929326 RepID=A0A976R8Q8_9VIRU|nr:hypothetical protein [Dipodfec virus UA23Rod_1071]